MATIAQKLGPEAVQYVRQLAHPLGQVLYPDLLHRRACEAMRAAAGTVHTKQEPAGIAVPAGSTTSTATDGVSGRSTECA